MTLKLSPKISSPVVARAALPTAPRAASKPALAPVLDSFQAAKAPAARNVGADVRAAREAAAAFGAAGAGSLAAGGKQAAIPGLFTGPGHESPVRWMPGDSQSGGGLGSETAGIGGNQRKPQAPADPLSTPERTAAPFDRRGLVSDAPVGKDDNAGQSEARRESTTGNTNIAPDVRTNNGWSSQQPGAHKAHDMAPDAMARSGSPTVIARSVGPGAREGSTGTTAQAGSQFPRVNILGPDIRVAANPAAVVDLHRNGTVGPGANPGRDLIVG